MFVVRARFNVTPFDSVSIEFFSGRIVKSIIMSYDEFKPVRRFYEVKQKFKPLHITPLMRSENSVASGVVKQGETIFFDVSYVTSDMGEVTALANISREIRFLGTKAKLEATSIEVVHVDNLSIGFRDADKQLVKLVFKTPVVLSAKLMAPPIPSIQRKLRRVGPRYILYPSISHICSYLAKLWIATFPDKPLIPLYTSDWAPYLFGRLCEATIATIDYRTKPVTVQYDEKRRIRGFTGWTIIDVPKTMRKMIERLDKLLALANYLGIGKSRGVGFGETKAITIEKRK